MSLSIGIACYPSVGGSGIVATQVGLAMADRGHQVHFVARASPHRLKPHPRVHLHEVSAAQYHVFQHEPYTLALASRLVAVAEEHGLDVVHAHYALPHAAAAWLAKDILGDRLRVVTTLHGTDITLVGTDPSYLPITRRAVQRSDAVTTPSRWLAEVTRDKLQLPELSVAVVPNFVDVDRFRPAAPADRTLGLAALDDAPGPLLVHVSNLRPLKRAPEVVAVAEALHQRTPVRLLILGDGPEADEVDARIAAGKVPAMRIPHPGDDQLPALLRAAGVFLLPSATESFGLAALEALASGVPVVATDVGGLPEVLGRDGACGRLVADGEGRVAAFTEATAAVLAAGESARVAARARAERFQAAPVVDAYEALYRGGPAA